MSRFKEFAVKDETKKYYTQSVTNFMGGTSFELNPMDALRIVAASSIFGEPSYYRKNKTTTVAKQKTKSFLAEMLNGGNKTTDEIFVEVIDNALDYDFKGTLEFAVKLRKEFNMRLNPSVIVVRAMIHENRVSFNETYPRFLRSVCKAISLRPDDVTNQFEYWMYLKGDKKTLPSVLKRAWADILGGLSKYQIKKYKSKSLIDLVRISHANSENINELMKTGDVVVSETEQTWETLRSQGKTWTEILNTIKIPHMALLRNLRGIFTEDISKELTIKTLDQLKSGVLFGKQFPFRYFTAYKELEKATLNFKEIVLSAVEECIDIAIDNMPTLKGKTAFLSDNSGSSWGVCNSEYGSVTIAEIANLSCMLGLKKTDIDSEFFVFGDNISKFELNRRNGLLSQIESVNTLGKCQGQGTENGIWLFWDNAIKNKIMYDNVFIYSDMQAGHGGLYGLNSRHYADYKYNGSKNIDVLKLVEKYRKEVNSKVNVFSVQVAGYNNSILPENLYRTSILSGWTGSETKYASELNDIWDSLDSPKSKQKSQ